MCGIIGYIGHRNTKDVLIEALTYLEYRGYDSAGIAFLDSTIQLFKQTGKIKHLTNCLPLTSIATTGIGHTRWATHGEPSDENAHPHLSANEQFAIVHNGIIENYLELKHSLLHQNYQFKSSTDTEIVVALLEIEYQKDQNFLAAFTRTINQCKGSWAILAICKDNPEQILTAKKDQPLIFGLAENEVFLASDVAPLLKYTKKVIYLEDNQIGNFSLSKFQIFDQNLKQIVPKIEQITWDIEAAKKSGYEHFMLKEIHEQPAVLNFLIQSYFPEGNFSFPEFSFDLTNIQKIIIVACGTAYHSALLGKYYFEEICNLPVDCLLASEARYKNLIVDSQTLAIAISQSGETEDTKKAFLKLKELGAETLAICNVRGSAITRITKNVIYTLAGPEIAVASTKAYTSQIFMLYLLTRYFASKKLNQSFTLDFNFIEKLKSVFQEEEKIKKLAKKYLKQKALMLLGRKFNYPTVLEAALKIKEISYIYAMGYAAGEMKHGPIALIENKFPVFAVFDDSEISVKMLSNLKEVAARRAELIIIKSKDFLIDDLKYETIELPPIDEYLFPLLSTIPFQLFAYYLSVLKGNDPDKPRNLAKSVTVE